MAESEEELKSWWKWKRRVEKKEEGEKFGLKLNI